MHTAPSTDRETTLAALAAALKGAGPGVKQAVHDTQQLFAQPAAIKPAAKASVMPAKRAYVRKVAKLPAKAVISPVKPAAGFAEMVDKMISLRAPTAPTGVKYVVINHYPDILRGYQAGVSLVMIAPALTAASGVDIKHGTLRNYFMSMAKERGDITSTTRAK